MNQIRARRKTMLEESFKKKGVTKLMPKLSYKNFFDGADNPLNKPALCATMKAQPKIKPLPKSIAR
jgi:hypothetical protein